MSIGPNLNVGTILLCLIAVTACERTTDQCSWQKISQNIPIETESHSSKDERVAACRKAASLSLAKKKQALHKAAKALDTDDRRTAIKTIVALADSGYTNAIAFYARMSVPSGIENIEQNLELAEKLATHLADQGIPLGDTIQGLVRIERGDIEGGLNDMRRAAATGHAHARIELALFLMLKRGLDRAAAIEARGLLTSLSREGNRTARDLIYAFLQPGDGPNDINQEMRYREWLWMKANLRRLKKKQPKEIRRR